MKVVILLGLISSILLSPINSVCYAKTATSFEASKSIFGGGSVSLPCELNSVAYENCKIDTGANFSSVKLTTLESLGPSIHQVDVMSFTGAEVSCHVTTENRIRISDSVFENSLLLACPQLKARGTDAIIGLDILSQSAFTIDFASGELVLNDTSAYSDLMPYSMDATGHLLLPVAINKNNPVMTKALFDTGAGLSLVDMKFVKRHPETFTVIRENTVMDTHGNEVVTQVVLAGYVKIGNSVFVAEYFMATDLSAAQAAMGEQIDFILGHNLIKNANWHFQPTNQTWTTWQP